MFWGRWLAGDLPKNYLSFVIGHFSFVNLKKKTGSLAHPANV
jgi:hypothetical protein